MGKGFVMMACNKYMAVYQFLYFGVFAKKHTPLNPLSRGQCCQLKL